MKDLKEQLMKWTKKQFPGARISVDLKPVMKPQFQVVDGVVRVQLLGMEGMDRALNKVEIKCLCGKVMVEKHKGFLSHMVSDRIPPAINMKPLCDECFGLFQELIKERVESAKKKVVKLKIRR